jgi:hypothetical protein
MPQKASEILKKYEARLAREVSSSSNPLASSDYSEEYRKFKAEMIPELSNYEKWARSLGNMIRINVAEKDRVKVQKFLDIAHLDVDASQALTLAILSMLVVFFSTIFISVSLALIKGNSLAEMPFLFTFLGILASMFVFYYTYSMPQRLANAWRLQASSQMVPTILYIVVYMKHTSNLERAIAFTAEHLEGPLALDFKKVFYDVQIGKYTTIKQSLDAYLETWKDYSPEFLESFHLIESSLFEPDESRRVATLEKSLQVILDGIYEKLLKYSRDIRSPLTNIYMLGIILPTLCLALLPLASALIGGLIQWQHLFIIFNIFIPFLVFYMASEVLLKRPGGYGETDILEKNPKYSEFISKKPWLTAFLISLPFIIIGLLPFIMQSDILTSLLSIQKDYSLKDLRISLFENMKLFDFKSLEGTLIGPFSPISIILSLFIPFGIAIFFSVAYSQKTKSLIKVRENTKALEQEFTNSLFQLGNRIGDNIPAEIAFGRVAESTQGLRTNAFFSQVNQNIQQLGMSLERAIFDSNIGAIISFPSALISTSMRILVESVKKGLRVAASSLMSISDYIKNIQKINQRLRDLLAEIISDMRSNLVFLAPLLSGIVIGLASMIGSILNKLQEVQIAMGSGSESEMFSSLGNITSLFEITQMIPPYFLQIVIGIYIIEITFILTKTLVTIDSGKDSLQEKYELANNLRKSTFLYLIVALISITALTILSEVALKGLTA